MASNGNISVEDTRTALLNGYIRKNKLFTTEDGISIEVRQPTVGQRSRMLAAGGISAKDNDLRSQPSSSAATTPARASACSSGPTKR